MLTHETRPTVAKNKYNVVPFERDVSYYFQKGNQYFFKNDWHKALLYFKKAIEIEPEEPLNHYNLGCLLSKMGNLEEANHTFELILEKLDSSYWECYFLLAINYGLMEEFEIAQSYLKEYLHNSPDGEMVREAEELLWAMAEDNALEMDEQIEDILFKENKEGILEDLVKLNNEEFLEKHNENVFLMPVLKKILYQSNDYVKEDVLDIFGDMHNQAAADVLKEFVRNPWVKDRHKQLALLKIKNMGYIDLCQLYLKGRVQQVDLEIYPLSAPFWEEKWQKVLNCTIRTMRQSEVYHESFFEDAQAMWIDFINQKYPEMPSIKKIETWAAGLEYSLVKFHLLDVTQKEIAEKYGISSASVSSKFKAITEALKINRKSCRHMLAHLLKANKGN